MSAPARVDVERDDSDHDGSLLPGGRPHQADLDDARARRLRLVNVAVGLVHLAQVVVILLLTTDFAIGITETFPEGPPGTAAPAPETVLDLAVGPAVAAFLGLAALDHLLVAAPGIDRWYSRNIRRGINPARWIEYSVSATLMVLLIALLAGVTDASALIGIAGANVAMILLGHRMERVNDHRSDRRDWQPFVFGCVAGIFPWIAIGTSILGAELEGTGDGGGPPTFVYGIFASLFVFFMSFAVNQWLQYRRVGPWRDYVVGEYGYLVLSLAAKSVLAWQVCRQRAGQLTSPSGPSSSWSSPGDATAPRRAARPPARAAAPAAATAAGPPVAASTREPVDAWEPPAATPPPLPVDALPPAVDPPVPPAAPGPPGAGLPLGAGPGPPDGLPDGDGDGATACGRR